MLSYLIESRKDVLVGNFIVDTSDTFDCSYTGVTKLSYVYRVP